MIKNWSGQNLSTQTRMKKETDFNGRSLDLTFGRAELQNQHISLPPRNMVAKRSS